LDASRFDGLTRDLTGGSSRRRLLTLLTVLPLAGALTTLTDEKGAAKRKGHNLHKHNQRHSGHRKDNRKGKRTGTVGNVGAPYCESFLTRAGCRRSNRVWSCPVGADLSYSNMAECDLSGANLESVNFHKAHMYGVHLEGANLYNTQFPEANMEHARLNGARMILANLKGVNLRFAIMWKTDLSNASLGRANLGGADMLYAILHHADLFDVTWEFPGASTRCPNGSRTDWHYDRTCCFALNGHVTPYCWRG
jgi:uncharacterized protein YjbI with pentapeptide repeats